MVQRATAVAARRVFRGKRFAMKTVARIGTPPGNGRDSWARHGSMTARAVLCVMVPIMLASCRSATGPAPGTSGPAGVPSQPAGPETPAAPQFDEASFAAFLSDLRREAAQKGISDKTIRLALTDLKPVPRVIELDRRQPEFTLTLDQYMDSVVSERRIAKGREKLAENRALLRKIFAQYGVQPRFIVAFWGIETDFGRIAGGFPIIPALATLAHDGRRAAYFRGELFNALRILDEGSSTLEGLKGSWAGAMGQTQFMPSTFLKYAVDYDGDGRRDIWNSRPDALASAANYLAKMGWNGSQTWGREVKVPKNLDPALANGSNGNPSARPLAAWKKLGVRRADGSALPNRDISARLLFPSGTEGPAFLVYDNFRVILNWNKSNFFGLAVGRLADFVDSR